MPLHVLFVCYGNLCRSPMAAAIFRGMAERDGRLRGRLFIDSAGVDAIPGLPATYEARRVMRERGLSLEDHRAKMVSGELVDWADLILVMERGHLHLLLQTFDNVEGKVHLLSEFVGEHGDIPDPFGRDVNAYRRTAERLERLLTKLKEKIVGVMGRDP